MTRLNWTIIAGDIKEAREQLQQIEKRIADKDRSSEGELLVMLEHAYHFNLFNGFFGFYALYEKGYPAIVWFYRAMISFFFVQAAI